MPAAEITVSVEGRMPDQLAQPFLEAVGLSIEVLRNLDAIIAMKRQPTLRWAISNMHIGSPAEMTLMALPPNESKDISHDVVKHYVDGLELLGREGEIPEHFTDDSLGAVKKLADLTRGNNRVVIVRTPLRQVQVSQQISVNVDEISTVTYSSDGSVEGLMEMVTLHERNYFRVYDDIHGWGVPCYFRQERVDEVRDALGRRVSITGRLRSDRFGKPESMQVSDIRVLGTEELPTPAEVRGIAKGMTGGLKAEEYLRSGRLDYE